MTVPSGRRHRDAELRRAATLLIGWCQERVILGLVPRIQFSAEANPAFFSNLTSVDRWILGTSSRMTVVT